MEQIPFSLPQTHPNRSQVQKWFYLTPKFRVSHQSKKEQLLPVQFWINPRWLVLRLHYYHLKCQLKLFRCRHRAVSAQPSPRGWCSNKHKFRANTIRYRLLLIDNAYKWILIKHHNLWDHSKWLWVPSSSRQLPNFKTREQYNWWSRHRISQWMYHRFKEIL